MERLIGSIRRECLDHFLIRNEAHLRRLLRGYMGYYNTGRPHQSLDNNSPRPREVQLPELGRVVAIPQVGGLHHLYSAPLDRGQAPGQHALVRGPQPAADRQWGR